MNAPDLNEQLARIEGKLDQPLRRELVKDFYKLHEFAQLVDKAEFTVREWARHGRIRPTETERIRGVHSPRAAGHGEQLPFATSNGRASR